MLNNTEALNLVTEYQSNNPDDVEITETSITITKKCIRDFYQSSLGKFLDISRSDLKNRLMGYYVDLPIYHKELD